LNIIHVRRSTAASESVFIGCLLVSGRPLVGCDRMLQILQLYLSIWLLRQEWNWVTGVKLGKYVINFGVI